MKPELPFELKVTVKRGRLLGWLNFVIDKVICFLFKQMESARKAWENSPNMGEKSSPVTSAASPIAGGSSSNSSSSNAVPSSGTYSSFSSASMPPIPVASVTPTTSLSGTGCQDCNVLLYCSLLCVRINLVPYGNVQHRADKICTGVKCHI